MWTQRLHTTRTQYFGRTGRAYNVILILLAAEGTEVFNWDQKEVISSSHSGGARKAFPDVFFESGTQLKETSAL
jgi:hypothetical protein